LRGNPTRNYPVSAVGVTFPGTFENYTASVLANWQDSKLAGKRLLDMIGQDLEALGLTWKIRARKIDDTKVELQIGRTVKSTRGGASDMVNVADVGFGVSQTLPVLVALLTARPGQVVYLEQPEIHLHPRAQVAMAKILANAALRGVRVVAETHSSLLLTGVQTLVANGDLHPDLVKLHWFTRDDGGETHISSADLDETGAFGDWPADFDEVALKAEGDYLNSADAQIAQGNLF
jgi:predicted ATPase